LHHMRRAGHAQSGACTAAHYTLTVAAVDTWSQVHAVTSSAGFAGIGGKRQHSARCSTLPVVHIPSSVQRSNLRITLASPLMHMQRGGEVESHVGRSPCYVACTTQVEGRFANKDECTLCCCSVALPDPGHPLVLLALDCEMCATSASDKELLQVAVVDQDGRQLMKVRACDTYVTCRAVVFPAETTVCTAGSCSAL
jgi:hypothetical protein